MDAKIRIKLESFNHELLTSSCQKITNILKNAQLNSFGMVSLPTKKRIYCVLRHPQISQNRLSSDPRYFNNCWSIKLRFQRYTPAMYILLLCEVFEP